MISFWRIFSLEVISLIRSRTLPLLAVASVGWIALVPLFVRGDGTAAGLRELVIRLALGGVFVLLVVALLATSAGTTARERSARRLQLTLVRPVSRLAVVLGRVAAQGTVGAVVLALACVALALRVDCSIGCAHVIHPLLPTPAEEAKVMYEAYMADPSTPAAVRSARKETVLRLLANRAVDRYQTVFTNAVASWRFDLAPYRDRPTVPSVRLRLSNQMSMRQKVVGEFSLGTARGAVSNVTEAILTIPLKGEADRIGDILAFHNRGKSAVMLRPRRDVSLLVRADGFGWNLLRAYLVMASVLFLLISFGNLLSASLSRPVALFVAFVVLIMGEMSPSVLEQYPDELETNRIDRLGLCLTRAAAEVTSPVSSLSPLTALSCNECIERDTVLRTLAVDVVLLPLLLGLLTAIALPRKQVE